MKNRSHPLRIWLMQNDLSMADFAARIGTTPSHLNHAVNRYVVIGRTLVERISRATKGAVVPADFDVGNGGHGIRNRPNLTPTEVRGIRKARKKGTKLQVLSAQYGVSMAAISRVANRQTHK